MEIKGIIFDFNGVLLWDTHFHERAWIDVSKKIRGFPFSQAQIYDHVHGKKNGSIIEYLLNRPVKVEEVKELSCLKESAYRNLCLQHPEEFQLSPGAVDLFDFLVDQRIPHTIATASEKENLDFFIEHLHLERWFDRSKIVYDDGTFPSKLEMYIQAAKNLNLTPKECIAIEDSKAGIQAAAEAGIGKTIGLGPKETHGILLSHGACEAIVSLKEFFNSSVPFCI